MATTSQIRDLDFIKECMRRLRACEARGDTIDLPEIIASTLESPAPGYYVNFDSAYRHVLQILKSGITGAKPRSATRCLYRDLAIHVRRVMDAHPELSTAAALSRVLNFGRAPRFYLSPARARSLLRPHIAYRPRYIIKG